MASSFLTFVAKWLVVPAGMAALGFYALGPQIGNNPALEAKVDPVKTILNDTSEPLKPETGSKKKSTGFKDIKVDVNLTEDDKKKPDSATEEVKQTEYFSPDAAGTTYEEIPELPVTPDSETTTTSPPDSTTDSGW